MEHDESVLNSDFKRDRLEEFNLMVARRLETGSDSTILSGIRSISDVNSARGTGLFPYPFRYFVIDNFLADNDFSEVADYVQRVCWNSPYPSSKERDYGAQIFSLSRGSLGPLSFLINRKLIEEAGQVLDVPVTQYVDAAIHSHPPGSPSGWLHTDFNTGWFADTPSQALVFSERVNCDYRTGTLGSRQHRPRELVRSIAFLFYFNKPWTEEHGGETVLCRSAIDDIANPLVRVPPLANRLLAFECSPISYHSFATTSVERQSVIFWSHAEPSEIAHRWPLSLRSGWK